MISGAVVGGFSGTQDWVGITEKLLSDEYASHLALSAPLFFVCRTPTFKNPTDYFMSVVKDKETSARLADAFRESEWTGSNSTGVVDKRTLVGPTPAEDPSFVSIVVSDNRDGQFTAVMTPSMVSGLQSDVQLGSRDFKGQRASDEEVSTSGSSSSPSSLLSSEACVDQSGAPFWYQVVVLCRRMLLNWVRSPVMLASEIIQYVFMSVFVGKSQGCIAWL